MKKKITIAIETTLLDRLLDMAIIQNRSRSNLIEMLLIEQLKITSHGDSSRTDKTEA